MVVIAKAPSHEAGLHVGRRPRPGRWRDLGRQTDAAQVRDDALRFGDQAEQLHAGGAGGACEDIDEKCTTQELVPRSVSSGAVGFAALWLFGCVILSSSYDSYYSAMTQLRAIADGRSTVVESELRLQARAAAKIAKEGYSCGSTEAIYRFLVGKSFVILVPNIFYRFKFDSPDVVPTLD